jgi:uncharacterized protein (TIGR03000 family)
MYSVVMMMAMTSVADTPTFGRRGCHGCYSSCHGCYSSCHGCYSSCHGCCGGWSSCYGGCCGGWSSCHGYGGCYGGYHGCCGGYYSSGCIGSCHGYTCGGGCGGYYISPYPVVPTPGTGVAPGAMTPPAPAPAPKPKTDGGAAASTATQATVVVSLPADAKLFADGQATALTSANRTFVTPALTPGKVYNYELRIEVVRDGQTRSETKNVSVSAGRISTVEFGEPSVQTAAR